MYIGRKSIFNLKVLLMVGLYNKDPEQLDYSNKFQNYIQNKDK